LLVASLLAAACEQIIQAALAARLVDLFRGHVLQIVPGKLSRLMDLEAKLKAAYEKADRVDDLEKQVADWEKRGKEFDSAQATIAGLQKQVPIDLLLAEELVMPVDGRLLRARIVGVRILLLSFGHGVSFHLV